MKKVMYLVASAAVTVSMFATGVAAHAASTSNVCTVEPAKLGQWGKAFTVNGTQVSASFKVVGQNCTTPVTLAVWERPTAEGINDQKLNNYVTKTFGPGTHSLSATLPNCMWQADVVEGANPTAADGTANYQFQGGKFVDGGLRDFLKGGAGVCKEPEQPTKPQEPEQPQKPTTPSTPVEPAAVTTPAELPNTGPAGVMAAAFGFTAVAGVAHNLVQRLKKQA